MKVNILCTKCKCECQIEQKNEKMRGKYIIKCNLKKSNRREGWGMGSEDSWLLAFPLSPRNPYFFPLSYFQRVFLDERGRGIKSMNAV